MKLSEKQWTNINRFIVGDAQPHSIADGVAFEHPKIPFELRAIGMRFIRRGANELDISLYRTLEWKGEGWTAWRTYIDRHLRGRDDDQTEHSIEGDLEKADEDMVLALLMVPQANRRR